MRGISEKFGVLENMGFADRSARAVIGALLTVPIIIAMTNVEPIVWQLYTTLVAFYLLITAMMGWDPFYAAFHAQSCGASDRSLCGSFRYEMDTALWHHPDHDKGYEVHALKPEELVWFFFFVGGCVFCVFVLLCCCLC